MLNIFCEALAKSAGLDDRIDQLVDTIRDNAYEPIGMLLTQITKFLKENNKLDLNKFGPRTKFSPLMAVAAYSRGIEVLKLLLENGAQILITSLGIELGMNNIIDLDSRINIYSIKVRVPFVGALVKYLR